MIAAYDTSPLARSDDHRERNAHAIMGDARADATLRTGTRYQRRHMPHMARDDLDAAMREDGVANSSLAHQPSCVLMGVWPIIPDARRRTKGREIVAPSPI